MTLAIVAIEAVPRQYRNLFMCAALTGARLGELLGLQWKHVDFKVEKLDIRQSLWHGELVSPKTRGSVRPIYFGPTLRAALETQLHESRHTKPDDFVFCNANGYSLHPDVLRKQVLYPALVKAGVPRVLRSSGFHTFRHSAASFINAETGNLKLAQKLLGHSSIDMTAHVYTHTSAEAERAASVAVERAIYGDLFGTVPRIAPKRVSTTVQ